MNAAGCDWRLGPHALRARRIGGISRSEDSILGARCTQRASTAAVTVLRGCTHGLPTQHVWSLRWMPGIHRPGPPMRLPARLLQLSIPPGALLRARLRVSGVTLLLRALRRIAPQQQRPCVFRHICSSLLQRICYWPPVHVVLRPRASNVHCPCTAVAVLQGCRHGTSPALALLELSVAQTPKRSGLSLRPISALRKMP